MPLSQNFHKINFNISVFLVGLYGTFVCSEMLFTVLKQMNKRDMNYQVNNSNECIVIAWWWSVSVFLYAARITIINKI